MPVTISRGGERLLTTQWFVKGHPQNDRDCMFESSRDERQRVCVLADVRPLEGFRIGELTARFDVVLGATPDDV
jgi:protocatechuate 3,4-dioxygenase beta subunit